MEARSDERFEKAEAASERRFENFESRIQKRFDEHEARMVNRFDLVESRLTKAETRLETIGWRTSAAAAGGSQPVVEALHIRLDPIETIDEVVERPDVKRVASRENGDCWFLAQVKLSFDW